MNIPGCAKIQLQCSVSIIKVFAITSGPDNLLKQNYHKHTSVPTAVSRVVSNLHLPEGRKGLWRKIFRLEGKLLKTLSGGREATVCLSFCRGYAEPRGAFL